jgi:acetolactate synthase-1/2/3 large subunit
MRDLVGDLAGVVEELAAGDDRMPWAADRLAEVRSVVGAGALERSPVDVAFLDVLAEAAAARHLAIDMTKGGFWAMKHLRVVPDACYAFSGYMAMGTALPMAIGLAAASGGPSLALVGDGGLQMSLAELATLAETRLPVTVVVMVDGVYGLLRDNGRGVGGSERLGVELWNPDFLALGQACELPVALIDTPAQLGQELARDVDGPRMIAVRHAFSRSW